MNNNESNTILELQTFMDSHFKSVDTSTIPMSEDDFIQLTSTLLNIDTCDHTLKATKEFLTSNELDTHAILRWFEYYGGYCDCEVLMNVMCNPLVEGLKHECN